VGGFAGVGFFVFFDADVGGLTIGAGDAEADEEDVDEPASASYSMKGRMYRV
jgi:hypothetical protein